MRYHIAFKYIAVVLCACSLLAAAGSALGIWALSDVGLYGQTLDDLRLDLTRADCDSAASLVAARYASKTLGNCPDDLLDAYFSSDRFAPSSGPWYYSLELDGKLLASDYDHQSGFQAIPFEMTHCAYISLVKQERVPIEPEYMPDSTMPSVTMPSAAENSAQRPTAAVEEADAPLDTLVYHYYDEAAGEYVNCTLEYYYCPPYVVTLYVNDQSFLPDSWDLIQAAYASRYGLIVLLAASLVVLGGCVTYICYAAGRAPGSGEVRPGGLNRLPLDLYAGLGGFTGLMFFSLLVNAVRSILYGMDYYSVVNWALVCLAVLLAYGICLIVTGFLYALAAQLKAGGGLWWRKSLIGRLLLLLRRGLGWAWSALGRLPAASRRLGSAAAAGGKRLWALVKKCLFRLGGLLSGAWLWFWRGVGRFFRWLGRIFKRFVALLPLTWQWLLTMAFLIGILFVAVLPGTPQAVTLLGLGVCLAVVLYSANAFGTLLESAQHMSKGDLNTKVDSRYLVGSFAEFAGDLNALADVAVVAAQKQMRSERMKAELITNVSHDIKTPLTSIINYVDLLQSARTEEEREQYLEVLERQSLRMKKLIEDLIEMSKASTGNIAVDLRDVDAVETVNQALGEFSDKLAAASLTPVFPQPERHPVIRADGRLAWRVLSNLLSNAVKYALPGTRLYIDLAVLEDTVLISLKNISRDQLNTDASELLERFVRGDASRNTEGSGLGLNIAKSLMELQGGRLQLLVDGDLFKVTLVFPKVRGSL